MLIVMTRTADVITASNTVVSLKLFIPFLVTTEFLLKLLSL